MSRDIVHQESLTLLTFSLVGKGRISRKPEVIVCIKVWTLKTRCQCSSQRGRTRARSSQDVDTVDHYRPSWVVPMTDSTTLATISPSDTDTRNLPCLPP